MARTKGSGFKMKSAAHGGPMRRNFPSAFKSETGKAKKMSKEEMEAESLRKAMEGDFEVKVSGGEKTKPGSFIQYPTNTGADSEGASIAGSSKRHTELRRLERTTTHGSSTYNPKAKMTSKEKEELRGLNQKTEKAYWKHVKKK